jgi:hypothetical protein
LRRSIGEACILRATAATNSDRTRPLLWLTTLLRYQNDIIN